MWWKAETSAALEEVVEMPAWSSQTLGCSTPPVLGSKLELDKVAVISPDTTADALTMLL